MENIQPSESTPPKYNPKEEIQKLLLNDSLTQKDTIKKTKQSHLILLQKNLNPLIDTEKDTEKKGALQNLQKNIETEIITQNEDFSEIKKLQTLPFQEQAKIIDSYSIEKLKSLENSLTKIEHTTPEHKRQTINTLKTLIHKEYKDLEEEITADTKETKDLFIKGVLGKLIRFLDFNNESVFSSDTGKNSEHLVDDIDTPIEKEVLPPLSTFGEEQKAVLTHFESLLKNPNLNIAISDFKENIQQLPTNEKSMSLIINIQELFSKAEKGDKIATKALTSDLSLTSLSLLNQFHSELTINPNGEILSKTLNKTILLTNQSLYEELRPLKQTHTFKPQFERELLDSAQTFEGHPYARDRNSNLLPPEIIKKNEQSSTWVTYPKHGPKKGKRIEPSKMPMVCARFITETLKELGIDTSSLSSVDIYDLDRTDKVEKWAQEVRIKNTNEKIFNLHTFPKRTNRQSADFNNFKFEVGDILTINKNKSVRHIGIITDVDSNGRPLMVMDSSGLREGVYNVPFHDFGSDTSSMDGVLRFSHSAQALIASTNEPIQTIR